MADPKVRFKRSSVPGKIPNETQVPLGEIALNTYDGKVFASKNVGIGTTVFVINPWNVGAGTDAYNIDFTVGNVGIGSTLPSSKLSVIGDVNILGVTTASFYYGDGSNLTGITATASPGGTDGQIQYNNNGSTGGSSQFYYDDVNNRVGIATSTPQYTLDVNGDINFNGSLNQNGSTFVASRWTSGTGDDIYRLNGNVGIGTTSPTSQLHVVGNILTSGTLTSTVATGTAPLTVSSTTLVTNLNADLLDGISSESFLRSDANDTYTGNLTISGSVSLGNGGAAATPQLRFDSDTGFYSTDGRIYVAANATNACYFDSVNQFNYGSIYITSTDDAAATAVTTTVDSGRFYLRGKYWNGTTSANAEWSIFNDVDGTGPNGNLRFYWQGVSKAAIDEAGNATFTGTVTASSDKKLKENIEVIPNALEKVSKIRGVTFTRNDQEDKEKRHAGVIAQEVEKVLPEVVMEGSDGIKSVAYGNLVGLLIEAIKDQQTQINELKEEINILKNFSIDK